MLLLLIINLSFVGHKVVETMNVKLITGFLLIGILGSIGRTNGVGKSLREFLNL